MKELRSKPNQLLDPVTRIEPFHKYDTRRRKQAKKAQREALLKQDDRRYEAVDTASYDLWSVTNLYQLFDPLYGQVVLPQWVWEVIHTPEMQAMHGRAQSSVPAFWSMTGTVCSTLEHAIGAAYLGELLLKNAEIAKRVPGLVASCLVHDSAGGPFRHFTDMAMKEILGYEHEVRLLLKLKKSKMGRVLAKAGFDLEEIAALCRGEGFGGELVGSKNGGIDADSADNVLRFNKSKGLLRGYRKVVGTPILNQAYLNPQNDISVHYNPERLVRGYVVLKDGRLAIRASVLKEIQNYYNQRQLLYNHVGFDMHLSAEVMLIRALQIAYLNGEINERFFEMTDEQARRYLLRCSAPCRRIVMKLDAGQLYYPIYREWVSDNHYYEHTGGLNCFPHMNPIDDRCLDRKKLLDLTVWDAFANEVAELLKLPPEEVVVQVRLGDKGYRQMKLPVLHQDGSIEEFTGTYHDSLYNPHVFRWSYRISIFASRRVLQPHQTVQMRCEDDEEEFEAISAMVMKYFSTDESQARGREWMDQY